MKRISRRVIADRLMILLRQGITSEKLALSLAVGISVGLFPLLGSTTVLCAFLALVFRMNFAAVQIGNWAVYPLQLVLLAPFMLAGNYLFGSYTGRQDANMMYAGSLSLPSGLKMISSAALHGIFIWAMLAPVLILVMYYIFLHMFMRWRKTMGALT